MSSLRRNVQVAVVTIALAGSAACCPASQNDAGTTVPEPNASVGQAPDSDRQMAAIARVLLEDRDANSSADADFKEAALLYPADHNGASMPKAKQAVYQTCRHVKHRNKIQVHDTPSDFADAYLDHRNAWRDYCSFFRNAEVEVIKAVLASGPPAARAKGVVDEYQRLYRLIQTTWRAVERLAVRYGVAVPPK